VALADEAGILVIVDEVQTGMGRTGKLFGHQWAEIRPDIMTLGKGIGGGVPLAALVAREEVCCFVPGDQGGTYNGNPLVTAAGCAVLNELTSPGFLDGVMETSAYLQAQLIALSQRLGLGELRGRAAHCAARYLAGGAQSPWPSRRKPGADRRQQRHT
jgi:acetylornithine/N-succinyldiaminopimelate aminotransferase